MTCIASIFLGLDLGLAVGLGIELITVVFRAQLCVAFVLPYPTTGSLVCCTL